MINSFSGNRRSRRHNSRANAPALIESLESRALLAGPQIVAPVGTIADSTPVISWEAVDTAVSYDLWVTDVETREVLFNPTGLATTFLLAPEELHLGRNRIWARANFADGSTTGWGAPTDVILQVTPSITGPLNAAQPATPFKINSTSPTITWTSPPGARSFEIFFSDQTTLTSKTFRVANLTPMLDADGNTIPDGNGDVVREEIREFNLPADILMGQYRVFMRTTDDGGRVSAWTSAYDFEVAPAVKLLRPTGLTFQTAPLLEWEAVAGATHYEVWVNLAAAPAEAPSLYPMKYLTTTSFQIPEELADGNYVFSVRAKRLHQVTEIKLTGTPTSGSYQIVLTTFGKDAKTQQTALISYTATAAQIKAAIVALEGFEKADVVAVGATPNLSYLLEIPQIPGQVRVNVVGSISPGTLTHTTKYPAEVVGLWSNNKAFTTAKDLIKDLRPTVTGPAGVAIDDPEVRVVTDVRPTLEWTPIDKAARYDVWVDRTASSNIYLRTTSSTSTYTFESDIQPGNYWIWVRAISVTGEITGWSDPYKFTATGGAPVITAPVDSAVAFPLPTIKWVPVPDAEFYEVQIAWLGVDFEFILTTGITLTEFTPTDPLNTGSYRVWVRAIKADGTALRWSAPVNFSVADADPAPEMPAANTDLALVESVLPDSVLTNARSEASTNSQPRHDDRTAIVGESQLAVKVAEESTLSATPVETTQGPNQEMELIQQLAVFCTSEEWWTANEA